MTSSSRGVLAASFAAGDTALPAAIRFTREVMTAWAAASIRPDAERLTGELVAEVRDGPFEIVWMHQGDSLQIEVREKDHDAATASAPSAPVTVWGVSFSGALRTRWARLPLPGNSGGEEPDDWTAGGGASQGPGWLGFLADASDLLAGTLDLNMVPALIAQIVVPRLATWCAVYTAVSGAEPPTPAYLWHADESQIDVLREQLEQTEIPALENLTPTPIQLADWQSLAFPLTARGRSLGLMCLGRAGRFPDEVARLAEDLARRAALAMDNARLYAQQADANRALQRSLLPPGTPAETPGLDYWVVYEPAGENNEVGGDFYDLFTTGEGSWRFAIGDVCGTGPEAAAVTGLARHTLRLLAREGYDVASVVSRLNRAILEEGERARFLTLLHGEITRTGDGLDLSLISAGHPEALRLRPSGVVEAVVTSQSLLGVFPEAEFEADHVHLAHGDVLLGVTDGVTERRSGERLLDDDGGLAKLLAECAELSARAVAERIRRAVEEYAAEPSADDLAILVLRAD
ncbi:PP2C family protein-serine/threonine phosphatase [Sphaerisporangium siamense]|uniref:Serine phosphatase RsbU (Regulator of sigma subunit) n=1 Tax=Sphaerisporangium siamense TaxID=795645 RepID=A0A7W7D2T7_9ACTN|nr:GAF domain-containing SpoIIE family protein phosphatase [Sphaerisporangium siamense]MBB4699162.1 serine phosphatase RsbU (regulator of sigma subunit) [Sphaerisporangium siamense]